MNRVQHFVGFVFREVRLHCHKEQPESIEIEIGIEPHRGIRGRCSRCQRPAPGYDRLEERRWLFVPLWGIPTYFRYAPRRVECAEHGVVVEHIPWSDGKRPVTCTMMGFLARWARRKEQVRSLASVAVEPIPAVPAPAVPVAPEGVPPSSGALL